VLAEAAEIEAALRELVANARAALPEGGPVRLEARREPGGEGVLLSVADDGHGMPPGLLRHCLEPFVATGGGGGLGLSAVHGFAQAHGGTFSIESAPGEGTVARLRLPARPRAEPAAVTAAVGAQVLLVEDDPDGRDELARMLGTLGYGVTAAASAEEAMSALQQEPPPDLLLADIVLPGGPDGTRLVEEARRLLPSLPAVLISGYAARPAAGWPEEEGVAPLLSKPIRRAELRQALRRALEGAGHAV
jgi:CheY-like chemotaxis protein/anti-sigma regulatory factor (Ser/Thr protein kinase)